ncbi:aspartate/glutamate racemase family protein [Pasteurellaceae bacterium LIM206]|nr:aspartate/glutamate racemase family protein [Pasteurellaceae bacterium LIM206]
MKTLGIIGGMSPESTITYYSEINRLVNQALGANYSAPIVMVSVEFEEIVQCQKSGDWDKAGEILAAAARKLARIGADGIVLATNTMHKVAAPIMQAVNIPFLHILDATADAIKAKGLTQVALLGTRFTMQDHFYRAGLAERSITALVPDDDTQAEIHRIIFDELCVGKFNPTAKRFYLHTINELARQGAEGVILGCTEIGLLIRQTDSALPFFDTAQLHSRMAADFILDSNK